MKTLIAFALMPAAALVVHAEAPLPAPAPRAGAAAATRTTLPPVIVDSRDLGALPPAAPLASSAAVAQDAAAAAADPPRPASSLTATRPHGAAAADNDLPEYVAVTERRNQAVGFAMVQAMGFDALVPACAQRTSSADSYADAAQAWIERNRGYLEASGWWIRRVEELVRQQEGDAAADQFRTVTKDNLVRSASKTAKGLTAESGASTSECARWAGILNSGRKDLDRDPEYALEYKEILRFRASVTAWQMRADPASREGVSQCTAGWRLSEAGDYPGALRAYDACLRGGRLTDAAMARAYRGMGITYRRATQLRAAIEMYDKAIALHPDDVIDDFINRGNAYDEAGDFDRAMADYAEALKLAPGNGRVHFERGIAYERHRMMDAAKKEFVAAYRHGLRAPDLYERMRVHGIAEEAE